MGAPKGNTNAAKSKLFDAALRRYLTQNPDDLRIAVAKFVEMAKAGELPAIRELADRLDGKPAQSIEMGVETRRTADELTDDALANIAAGGSAGVIAAANSPKSLN